MKSVINELWYGNINPNESGVFNTPEMKKTLDYIIRHSDELKKGLTEEQTELFEKLSDSENEFYSLAQATVFSCGFRLGAKMIMDILYGETSSK